MPSLQSRLFTLALRYRHLFSSEKKIEAIDWDTSIPDLRATIERGAQFFGKLPKGFSLEPFQIPAPGAPDLKAEWMLPPGGAKTPAILYFHGGGYTTGSIAAHRPIVAKFVRQSGLAALVFDYRLAPEHPYPAALDDALAAYRWLLAQGTPPARIVFSGDSAGGGLLLATLLKLRDLVEPLPAGAVALSPWTDLANTGASLTTNAEVDRLSWKNAWVVFSQYYAGDHDRDDPYLSPLYGDLHGLPPLRLYAGGDETLRDDTTRFAEKAQKAGVDVRLTVGAGLFHCYPATAPLFPEATQAMSEICAFFNQVTSANGNAEGRDNYAMRQVPDRTI